MRRSGRELYDRLRTYLIVAMQAGLAAGLAWFVADTVLDNAQPLFAPAVAIGVIAGAIGHRLRRSGELIAGVVVGAFVGHWLLRLTGTGPARTGLVVALAISVAVLFRGGGATMAQAGSTAVLLGLMTGGPDLAVPRTESALVGGVTALAVALLILPLNPLRVVRRAAGPTADLFAGQLTAAAQALTSRDLTRADEAFRAFATGQAQRQQTAEMIAAAGEVAALSPWRRRGLGMVRRYQGAAEHLDNVYTSGREMMRWIVVTIREGEPVPANVPAAIEHFGEALRLLHRDFLAGREPEPTRARALQAIREADEACAEGLEFSANAVVAQLRAAVSELLQASGLPEAEANEQAGLTRHG
ncbi:FUSC family protein [Micromonospora palomenae]|uniref:FUSC family protein n=1 Tax=Micromonospora palomenae TaxID=1461247 RepID=UPI001FE482FA|nr:FUSC family protein [Micromonospora palomenae]